MAYKRARPGRSASDVQKDEVVRKLVHSLLSGIGADLSHLSVSVGRGIVSLRGEVRNTFELGSLADSIRSLPLVKGLDARVKVLH